MIWQVLVIVMFALLGLGLYSLFSKRNLIKILIGIEIMAKAATLSFIFSGWMQGNSAIAQAIVITVILIDVIVVAVALSLAVNVYKQTGKLSVEGIMRLRD